MTEYYKEKLQAGLEYQDYITDLLLNEIGLPISTYSSKKYQYRGENAQGVEIKFDDQMAKTGNVYIEIAEKTRAENPDYVPSGIYREDNTWLYVIGDYKKVYIFSKKFLIQLHKAERYTRLIEIATSRGFLLNNDLTEKYCIKKIAHE